MCDNHSLLERSIFEKEGKKDLFFLKKKKKERLSFVQIGAWLILRTNRSLADVLRTSRIYVPSRTRIMQDNPHLLDTVRQAKPIYTRPGDEIP